MGLLDINDSTNLPGFQAALAAADKLVIYRAGSENLAPLFEDPTLNILVPNPVKLDGSGTLDILYLYNDEYDVVLKDLNGRITYEAQNVPVRAPTALSASYRFQHATDLITDSLLSYTAGKGLHKVVVGDIVNVDNGNFGYEVLASGDSSADLTTQSGVALKVFISDRNEINVRAFGARGDGVTDDGPAFNRALTVVQAVGATLIVPPGHYRYGEELNITGALTFQGGGRRDTIFEPMPGYSGWFMGITESNFINTNNDGPVVNLVNDNSGLKLVGFSVRSSRDLGVGPQHGIRCIGRNDRMHWDDIYIECLEGTHFYFGYPLNEDTSHPAFIRECDFYNIESRAGGEVAGQHASVVFDSYGPGDASNLSNFYSFRVVYAYYIGTIFINNATNNSIRRLNFFGFLMHGPGSTGIPSTHPLCTICGNVSWCNFYSLQINSTVVGQSGMKMEAHNDGAPSGMRLLADVSSGEGDSFEIDAGTEIFLSCTALGSTGTDLRVGAAVTGPITFDTMGKTPSMIVAPEAASFVSAVSSRTKDLPIRAECIAMGFLNTSPQIVQGSGAPESNFVAPAGSIFLNRGQNGSRDADAAFLKRGGLGATGWDPIMTVVGGSTAQRPGTPTDYQYFYDTTEDRPVFANNQGSWVSTAVVTDVPATATSAGHKGDIAADATHVYVCIADDSWVRVDAGAWA